MQKRPLRPKKQLVAHLKWRMRNIILQIEKSPPHLHSGLYHELRITEDLMGIVDHYYENKTTAPISKREREDLRKSIIEEFQLKLDL